VNSQQALQAALAEWPWSMKDPRASLLPVLQAVQRRLGYLPTETFVDIETQLGIPRQVSYSVASFYDDFRFDPPAEHCIRVCDGAACELAGCREMLATASRELGIGAGEVTSDRCFRLEAANCFGQCDRCPAVKIDQWVLGHVSPTELPGLLWLVCSGRQADQAELEQRAQRGSAFPEARPGEQRRLLGDVPHPLAEMAQYEAAGGFSALKKLVGHATPAELIERVNEAGLRGRGGAGFPTAKKWQLAVANPPPRVLVCNADESEPGTFKDRFLLTHRPFLVLEGMVLAGYAIGADHGVLYLRSDYAHLQPALETCLQAMALAGLVGDNIAGSGFAFRIDVRIGAGAYVCGEESALLESLEGKRGEPRLRPPFPVEAGLSGRPTVVDNVETLAYIPRILEHGSAWFREVGTADSPGTKLFSLSGDIACPGVYELPLGVSLGALIDGAGGGMLGRFGFALIGGAAGRVVRTDAWDSPLDFQHQLGNGSVTVFHQGRDPLEIGANLLRFFSRETCGACLPCRVGVAEARTIIESAMAHGPTEEGRESFRLLAECLETTSRCGLGKTALKATADLLNLTTQRP